MYITLVILNHSNIIHFNLTGHFYDLFSIYREDGDEVFERLCYACSRYVPRLFLKIRNSSYMDWSEDNSLVRELVN